MYAIDFGVGNALAIHGPTGPVARKLVKLPRRKKGEGPRPPAMFFPMVVEALFKGGDGLPAGDVVVESATIGSSGCEPRHIEEIVGKYPERKLFTITTRAIKNYRMDNGIAKQKGARYSDPPETIGLEKQEDVHVVDARLSYIIATTTPHRLHHWSGPSEPCNRDKKSVRPMDKWNYENEVAKDLMEKLPPFSSLPPELREILGSGKPLDYTRSMVIPFAMASLESCIGKRDDGRRKRYEKLIGLYDRGYPSFYRRATIVWMTENAKSIAGVTKKSEVSPEVRKQAWKVTQRQIRQFFHLTMAHQEAQGLH